MSRDSEKVNNLRMRDQAQPGVNLKKYAQWIIFSLALLLGGCTPSIADIEPKVELIPLSRNIDCLPSAFPRLTPNELQTDWGKALQVGLTFGKEFDLYRAITEFKRALILIPRGNTERRMQIEYSIAEAYYLGQKYQDMVDAFERSDLTHATPDFPAFGQLIVILYDSYRQVGLYEKANRIYEAIEKGNPIVAHKLKQYVELTDADFVELQNLDCAEINEFLVSYESEKLSVRKAQYLNAVLPGAGYYYVGQKKSALTAFVINALFSAAAYQFFDNGYIAAGLITTSFEMGWYLGGINGAGLEAREFNERLYETKAKDFMIKQRLFPILMFETSF